MFPIAPMGKLLTCLPDSRLHNCERFGQPYYSGYVPQKPCNFPIAPMGDSRFDRCLQGGGVYVSSGTVAISSSTISGNSASSVRAHALKSSHCPDGRLTISSLFAGRRGCFLWRHSGHLIMHHQWEHSCQCARASSKVSHRPDGKKADVLASTHACTTAANTSVNYSMYVPQRPCKFPIAMMGKCLADMRESRVPTLRCSDHCYHAFLIPCPGCQCLCPRRHGLLLGNDPHRRLWHSLSLPSTPPSAAAIATAIATPFATAPLAAALTSTTLATAAFATASLTATTFATTLATTLATTFADGGEHQRRPDRCTRQHNCQPHCPGPRHLLPQRRAQHHQERHPRGGRIRHGRAECTGELFESAPCAVDKPGLIRRRATDQAQHHGRLHRLCMRAQIFKTSHRPDGKMPC